MNTSTVLRANNINKHFYTPEPFHVLKDVNLTVGKGEFTTVMGKSGCGKSTLLYILSTMDTQYNGELYIHDQLVTGKTANELAYIRNNHIGFVFQFHYLLSDFSVLENVMLPAQKLAQRSPTAIKAAALEKLAMLDIDTLAYKKAANLSGGEKQRVAIARALINDPAIIMGDEPTGNLDSHNASNVFDIFKRLSVENGLSLLIVTHDKDFATKTDRIIQMKDGRIVSN